MSTKSKAAKTAAVSAKATDAQYGRDVFEAIVAPVSEPPEIFGELLQMKESPTALRSQQERSVSIDERGVHVHVDAGNGLFSWTYHCDVDGAHALTAPALPFRFTAPQLAAFMLDGVGHFVRSFYGRWSDGPEPGRLAQIGPRGGQAKAALMQAYDAYRSAERATGALGDRFLDVEDLADRYDPVRREDETDAAYKKRVTPFLREVEARRRGTHGERDAARREREQAQSTWRKKIVGCLLQLPTDDALLVEAIGEATSASPSRNVGGAGRKGSTDEQIKRANAMRAEGKSVAEAAAATGMSVSQVRKHAAVKKEPKNQVPPWHFTPSSGR